MADNTTLDPGAGGSVIATDDITGVHYQRVKLTDGVADSATVIAAGGGAEAGALRVTVASDSTGVLSVDDNGGALSVDDNGGSLTVDNAALAVVGGGTEATALRVTVANDSTGVVSVDDNGGSLTVDVGAALPAGTNNIGDVDVASIAAGANTIGAVNVKPATSGGTLIYRDLDANATGELVKGSAGQLFGWHMYNDGAAEVYVKFYNKATAPTVGTDTPVMTVPIPAGAGANVEFTNGIEFATGIGVGATTAVADASTAAPAANQVIVNLLYK